MALVDFQNGLTDIISEFGATVNVVDADGTNARNIDCVISSLGKEDVALVNAYGVESRVMYTTELVAPPKKFGRVTYAGLVYVVKDVNPIDPNGTLVGYKCVVKQ